jgi:hypothetical protein
MSGRADGAPPTLVVLRPLGSALAVGFTGLAVVSLLNAGTSLGWVTGTEARQAGLLVLVTVVPLQLVASIFALLSRDATTGAAMALMAVTWAAVGVSEVVSAPAGPRHAIGLVGVAAGALLVLEGATVAAEKALPGLTIVVAGGHFVLLGIHDLGAGDRWQHAAGLV